MHFPNETAEYRAARDDLLTKEIELRRAMEAVAVARRALPPGGEVPQDYVFAEIDEEDRERQVRLSELFAPAKGSLIIYSMMFPRHPQDSRAAATEGETAKLKREEQPCPSCTGLLDQLDGAVGHLEAAGFNFAVVAQAPAARLAALGRDRGWRRMRLLSSAGNSFKHDYHALFEDGAQAPLLTVFQRGADGIRHFWSSEMLFAPADPGQDPRAAGTIEPLWNLMDLTPEGRPDWEEQMEYGAGCCG